MARLTLQQVRVPACGLAVLAHVHVVNPFERIATPLRLHLTNLAALTLTVLEVHQRRRRLFSLVYTLFIRNCVPVAVRADLYLPGVRRLLALLESGAGLPDFPLQDSEL